MHKVKAIGLLGRYINGEKNDQIVKAFRSDAKFSSFRYMYTLKSPNEIVSLFSSWMVEDDDVSAYSGFYMSKEYAFKPSLQPCILLTVNRKDQVVSILTVKMKRGKIQEVIGMDPTDYLPTRGELFK